MIRLETEQMAWVADHRQGSTAPRPGFVWVAYYDDHSSVVPCETEIDALRIAVDRGMKVLRVPYGTDVWDAVVAENDVRGR